MRRGFHGLSAQVQTVLEQQPLSGHVFVFSKRSRLAVWTLMCFVCTLWV
jgi:transposase